MTEGRTTWLLVFLLIAQLVWIAAQVPGADGEPLLERLALKTVAPFARTVVSTTGEVIRLPEHLRLREDLLAENKRLTRQIEALELDLARLRRVEQDARRLAETLRYSRPFAGRLQVADIVYADYASLLRTLVIYIGDRPVEVNQPVIASDGLVGRIILVSRPYAKVQLITDRAATVGVMIERNRRQGVVRGGLGGDLELDFVPLQVDVRAGEPIVTSGIDGVYPRGIEVGRVVSVEPSNELFHEIRVQPAVDFGVLDQVYILIREQLPESLVTGESDARP